MVMAYPICDALAQKVLITRKLDFSFTRYFLFTDLLSVWLSRLCLWLASGGRSALGLSIGLGLVSITTSMLDFGITNKCTVSVSVGKVG